VSGTGFTPPWTSQGLERASGTQMIEMLGALLGDSSLVVCQRFIVRQQSDGRVWPLFGRLDAVREDDRLQGPTLKFRDILVVSDTVPLQQFLDRLRAATNGQPYQIAGHMCEPEAFGRDWTYGRHLGPNPSVPWSCFRAWVSSAPPPGSPNREPPGPFVTASGFREASFRDLVANVGAFRAFDRNGDVRLASITLFVREYRGSIAEPTREQGLVRLKMTGDQLERIQLVGEVVSAGAKRTVNQRAQSIVEIPVEGALRSVSLSLLADDEDVLENLSENEATPNGERRLLPTAESTEESRTDRDSPTTRVFVSHASADLPLVRLFVDRLVEAGIAVPSAAIYCSSAPGQGAPLGADFKEAILENLDSAEVVIALISRSFRGSEYCMYELGAAWATKKFIIPVLVPPARLNDLPAFLAGKIAVPIDAPTGLDKLRDALSKRLDIPNSTTDRWNMLRDEFLAQVGPVLRQLPDDTPVARAEVRALEAKLEVSSKQIGALEGQLVEARKLNEALARLKDPEEVKEAQATELPDTRRFKHLVGEARLSMVGLSKPLKEALFFQQRGEEYVPRSSEVDGVVREQQYLRLKGPSRGGGFVPDENDTEVAKALSALGALRGFLSQPPEDPFDDWHEAEYGRKPDLDNRGFWERHKLL
jgi:hypothetical protein